jgi:hypothetical protein
MYYYPVFKIELAFYRAPLSSLINAFVPMLVLAFLAMMIFSSKFELGDRIANISVILLAYIAFIPSLRSFVPPV